MAHYLISEASRRLHVEAHVLRYWEEELQLEIPRNELGHRYYTEKQLALFQRIKELKELGYQLKAIRTSLHEEEEQEAAEKAGFFVEDSVEDPMEGSVEDSIEGSVEASVKEELPFTILPGQKTEDRQLPLEASGSVHTDEAFSLASSEKLEQFQNIMTEVMAEALRRNHEEFSRQVGGEISDKISDKVAKEMNCIMRDREEREEERYRKLDETIRACQRVQKQKREAAATRVPGRRRKKLWGHKK